MNSLATPLLYDAIAGTPGTTGDTLAYNSGSLNDTARPGCPVLNWLDQQDENHGSAYWKQRDLIAETRGKTTPLFLTQGFIEDNTKPDGAWDIHALSRNREKMLKEENAFGALWQRILGKH